MLWIHYLSHDKFVSIKALSSKSESFLVCSTIARDRQDFSSWKISRKVMIKKLKAEHRGDNPLSAVLEGFMVFLFALFGLLFVCSLWTEVLANLQLARANFCNSRWFSSPGYFLYGAVYFNFWNWLMMGRKLRGPLKQENLAQDEWWCNWIKRTWTAIRSIFRNF